MRSRSAALSVRSTPGWTPRPRNTGMGGAATGGTGSARERAKGLLEGLLQGLALVRRAGLDRTQQRIVDIDRLSACAKPYKRICFRTTDPASQNGRRSLRRRRRREAE